MPIRAVLFDFDGVIADTENVHIAAWERTFALMGWEIAAEVCTRAAEEDDRLFLTSIFSDNGVTDGDVEGWVKRKQELTLSMLSEFPRIYPGLHELVTALRGKVTMAVVSGTWRANVTTVLQAAGLEADFSTIISKEDVKDTKPDPSAYEFALKTLGIKPEDAVALEDSPSGIAAANGAGVRAVAIGHRRPEGTWHGEATYIRQFDPIADVLKAIGIV